MEKIYLQIENYLKKTFPTKRIVLNGNLVEKDEDIELYGLHGMPIIIREFKEFVEYRPKFESNEKI